MSWNRTREDFLGKRFSYLTVIGEPEPGDRRQHWLCRCDCGTVKRVMAANLKSGSTKSCGCYSKDCCVIQMNAGDRYGELTIVGPAQTPPHKSGRWWLCKCDCGETFVAHGVDLRNGKTISCPECGFKRSHEKHKSHGMSKTRLYKTWKGIKDRCNNQRECTNAYYHAKGITYCPEWERFEPFMEWALANGYNDSLEIDRIDFNGNYEPSNCRWVTKAQQNRNKSSNIYVEYNGQTMCLADAIKASGMKEETARHRYVDLGWSVEKTFNTPVRKHKEATHKGVS